MHPMTLLIRSRNRRAAGADRLVVATALTLVFVPALYAAWLRIRRDSPARAPADVPLAVDAALASH